MKYPTYGMSLYRTGRKLRVSALHPKLQSAGAAYGEVLGYERPLFFKPDEMGKSKRGRNERSNSFVSPWIV